MQVRVGASVPREFAMRFGRGYRAGNQMTYARILAARLQARYALPMTEAWRRGFVNDLAPGPFIESDHPAIAQRASRLAANGTDPTAVAGRIVAWLHDSVRASPAATPLTAAGALDGRAGDAREFALLTTAMLRAAGIPARPVTGLLQLGGRFYLHAWTEIYLGRWVPVDAMLNQFPADAAHITFLTGTADPGPDLGRILGRLEMTVVSTVGAPK
jgi:transglutaminase-like putative cysteine protease